MAAVVRKHMVLIIIPAFNEEPTIGRVLRGLFEQGWKEVVVIDDGSTDATGEIAKREGAVVLRHAINRGQGAALETGNEYARRVGADIVAHFDADDQLNPADIAPALALMQKNNLDVVLGSRFLDNRTSMPWLKRRIILPASRWINFVFTGVLLTDAHNGFRVLSRRALEKIVITQNGMAHNSEIIAELKEQGLRFAEHPVAVRYFEFGQGFGGGLKIIWDLIISHI